MPNNKYNEWTNKDLDYCTKKYIERSFKIDEDEKSPLVDFRELINSFNNGEDFMHHYPWSVLWRIGSDCNLRCKHCFFYENPNSYNKENDLTTKEALNIVDVLTNDFGICRAVISGGEPFLRKDILEIISAFKKGNVSLYLQTNGALINEELANGLSKILNPYIDAIQMSLDGATTETNRLMRCSDSFDKTINAIKLFVKNGIPVNVNCTVTKYNQYELIDLYNLCKDLKVKVLSFSKFIPMSENHVDLVPNNDDLFKIAEAIQEMGERDNKIKLQINIMSFYELLENKIAKNFIDESDIIHKKQKLKKDYVSCHNDGKLFINPDGKIYLCFETAMEEYIMGDIRKNSLNEIWDNRHKHILFCKRPIEKIWCNNCKYFSYCKSGCPAFAIFRYNDFFAPDGRCNYYSKMENEQYSSTSI